MILVSVGSFPITMWCFFGALYTFDESREWSSVSLYLPVITEIKNMKEHVFATYEFKKNLKNKISFGWIYILLFCSVENLAVYIAQDNLHMGYITST